MFIICFQVNRIEPKKYNRWFKRYCYTLWLLNVTFSIETVDFRLSGLMLNETKQCSKLIKPFCRIKLVFVKNPGGFSGALKGFVSISVNTKHAEVVVSRATELISIASITYSILQKWHVPKLLQGNNCNVTKICKKLAKRKFCQRIKIKSLNYLIPVE